MSRDFQQTHENLLACAKKHFLENGFERASIREICKAAHVTNGRTKRLCSAHLSNQWFRRYLRCIPILSSSILN